MEKGSSNNLGIPSTWLDENASDPIYANRYYSRENGWELIYSNITESTPTKYLLYTTNIQDYSVFLL